MAYYKLVASGRPDVVVDEIILARSEETGEVTKSVSTSTAVELSDEELSGAKSAAENLGYQVVEADAPQEGERPEQQVGADVVGESPLVEQTGPSTSQVSQQAEEQAVEQADSEGGSGGVGGVEGATSAGESGTSESGTSGSGFGNTPPTSTSL